MVRKIAAAALAAALILCLTVTALAESEPDGRTVININNVNVNINGQPWYGGDPAWLSSPWYYGGPMSAGALTAGLYAPNGVLYVQGKDGRELPYDAPIATGDTIVWKDAMNNIRTTEMVVKGDVLGTGILSVAQLVRLAQALNGSAPLYGAYLLAGDLNGNGYIDIADLTAEAQLLW